MGEAPRRTGRVGLLLVVALVGAAVVAIGPARGSATLVPEMAIERGAVWRYHDRGVDLAAAWRTVGYDDSSWSSGPGQLGYGDGDETTVVSYGGDPADKHPTTYFRHTFTLTDPATITAATIDLLRDDGAVVYLNGTEIHRTNLPNGTIAYNTWALTWDIDETNYATTTIDHALLVAGTNTIAVEVHQAWRTSSDLGFDLALTITRGAAPTPTPPPTPTPTPTPPPGGEGVVMFAGDIGHCGAGIAPFVGAALQDEPGTWAPVGDLAYPDGTAADFANCYDPYFGHAQNRSRPVPGNHEYRTAEAGPYFDYFGALAGNRGEGWHSYDTGGWHIVALNSTCWRVGGCSTSDPQYQWLVADLAASDAPCVAAYFHDAYFTSEAGGAQATWMQPYVSLLEAEGLDVLFGANSHNYERFARRRADGAVDPSGWRSFVVGIGGHPQDGFGAAEPGSEVRYEDTYGFLRVTFSPGSYAWELVHAAGIARTDTGSDTC